MLYVITDSINNPTVAFNLNGLEYQKGVYTVVYSSYESNNGVPENVYISIINKVNRRPLISNVAISRFSDGFETFTEIGQILSKTSFRPSFVLYLHRYIDRVNQDGGTIEAVSNLINKIDDLGGNPSDAYLTYLYDDRLTDDSAIYEATDNVINKLEDIGFTVITSKYV